MTINSVQTILTDRKFPSPPPNGHPQSVPKVYNAPDFPFKGWQPPQPEGYEQSAATPSESAIVIDNGIFRPCGKPAQTDYPSRFGRLKHCESRLVLRQAATIPLAPPCGAVPRPQIQQSMHLCRLRCLRRCDDTGPNSVRLRAIFQHCQQL